jgi:hypothetical protein
MALISCPECNKQVSEKAPQCPHCGVPIATVTGKQEPKPGDGGSSSRVQKSFRLTKPTGGIGKAIGGLLSVVVAFVAVIGIKSCVNEATNRAEEQKRNEAIKRQLDENKATNRAVERMLGDDIKNFNKNRNGEAERKGP